MATDPASPLTACADLVTVLNGSQADLLARTGRSDRLHQPGGALLSEPFTVPLVGPDDPVWPRESEASVETFVVSLASDDGSGEIESTGPDPAVADWWRPTVAAFVARVAEACRSAGVALGSSPAYVTVSATPTGSVAGDPHLDDDQPRPGDGVGLVAIAGSHAGPRIARGAIGCRDLAPPAPVEVDPSALAAFTEAAASPEGTEPDVHGSVADGFVVETFPADRIVLLPRFGQLHAGPRLAAGPDGVRSLLVLRADTVVAG